jgi:sugar phosphate isomerase/epimerase
MAIRERPHLPRGVGALAVQPYGDERETLVEHARERRYGVEIGDFAFPRVLDDPAECGNLIAWYRDQLAENPGPHALHGALSDLHPASVDPKVVALARDRIGHCLDIAETLEVVIAVCHSDFNPGIREPDYPGKWVARQAEFWREMMADRLVTVALENLWDRDPETLRDAIDAIGLPSVGVCLDAGHAHLHSGRPLTEWVAVLGSRIRRLHFSDNNRQWDQHLALGQGTVGWSALLAALDAAGLDLPATLEVGGLEGVQISAVYLHRLASASVGGRR